MTTVDAAALIEPVERQAAARPGAVGIVDGERTLTYAELAAAVSSQARRLLSAGVGAEARVGLYLPRGADFVVGLLAVLAVGAAVVPLDPSQPAARLDLIARDAGLSAVLTGPAAAAVPAFAQVPVIEAGAVGKADGLCRRADPEQLAYIVYTSGSTGRPKGAMVTRRGLANLLSHQYLVDSEPRTTLQYAPTSFDVMFQEILSTLSTGGRLVVVPENARRDQAALLDLITAHQVHRWYLPPGVLEWAADALWRDDRAADSLRELILAGEQLKITDAVRELASRHRWTLRNQYGPAETHVVSEYVLAGDPAGWQTLPPIGHPIPGARLAVVDEELRPCQDGVPGELVIGGVAVGRGYVGRPDLTAERYLPATAGGGGRWYRTGDLARRGPDGYEFLGRVDDQVKIRGYRVEPGEVEAVLAGHPDVKAAVVRAATDGTSGTRLVGYVQRQPGSGLTPDALRDWVAARLPEFMVPAVLVAVEAMPLTPTGKVDRRRLPDPRQARPWLAVPYVAPRDSMEESIAKIWSEVAGIDKVGAFCGFFDLGGHSLLATRAAARVGAALGVDVSLGDLMRHPTPAALAAYLRELPPGPPVAPLGTPSADVTALSSGQRQLWLAEQLRPGSAAYHIPVVLDVSGSLDRTALGAALTRIVGRHAELRAAFPFAEGGPGKRIDAPADIDLPVREAAGLTSATELAKAELRRPFDLSAGPLARAMLIRYGPGHHLFVWVAHHLVFDGVSIEVFLAELDECYRAARAGRPDRLAELPATYADYVRDGDRAADAAAIARGLEYWRAALDELRPLQLPTDRPRPPVQSLSGGTVTVLVHSGLASRLRAAAAAGGTSVFVLLLAGYAAVLSRFAGQDDIGIGAFVTHRPRPEYERLIGFFVDTVVVRADASGDPTFTQFLRRLHERVIGALEHHRVPVARLVAELAAARDPARHPLFQVAFGYEPRPWADGATLDGLSVRPVPFDLGAAKFDLETFAVDHGDAIELRAEFSTDLLEAATVERLLNGVGELLAAALDAPERPLADLPVTIGAADSAARSATVDHAALVVASRQCIHELFEARAAERPDAPALIDGARTVSYGELNAAANRLATVLRRHGVGPEQPVIVHMGRTAEAVIAILGVLKAGGGYVPLDTAHPRERLIRTAELAGARVVVSDGTDPDGPDWAGHVVVDPASAEVAAASPADLGVPVTPAMLAYLIFTSGSTGVPKGVAIEHRQVTRLFPACAPWLSFGPDDVWPLVHSLAFDVSVWEMWGALLHGGRLVLVSDDTRRDPAALARLLERTGATILSQTPSAFTNVLRLPAAQLDRVAASLRAIVFAGEALAFRALAPWTDRFGTERTALINMYGITEITVHGTAYRLTDADLASPRSIIGEPLADLTFDVVDARLRACQDGVSGELLVGGSGVGRGYWRRPGLTAARFVPDSSGGGGRRYRSGDVARRLPDGRLEFLGRADGQLKVRGYRVEPGEVEAAVLAHPDVTAAVVAGAPDPAGGQRLVGYVVPAGPDFDPGGLRAWLAARLPAYLVPAVVLTMPRLPLTPSGKVDRAALPDPSGTRSWLGSAPLPARDHLERTIADVWSDVLGVRPVGVQDNFFDLGGHSLLAVEVHRRLADRLPRPLSVMDLFRYPTVAALADAVRGPAAAGTGAARDRGLAQRQALARRSPAMKESSDV